MTNQPRRPDVGGLLGGRADHPDLKELTISMGHSDLYVNLARRTKTQEGHLLFEAILTDEQGSRLIYVDRDDIAECLRSSVVLTPPPVAEPG